MNALLRFLSWRHATAHRLRTFLCVGSVALGVALFVSMETAQATTERAFETAHGRLAGKAQWRITKGRGLGLDEEVLETLAEKSDGLLVAPVLEVSAALPDFRSEGRLLVLGVDFAAEGKMRDLLPAGAGQVNPIVSFLDPGAIFITRAFAQRNRLEIGSTLRLTTPTGLKALRIGGILDDRGAAAVLGGRIAFVRYPEVQALFARRGSLDRIDVAPASGSDPELGRKLRDMLGPDVRVNPVRPSNKILDNLLANMRSLIVLSVIALMVGLFIVYLSVSIGVVERARAIGTLRALGATRGQVQRTFLLEAALLGVVGSTIGVGLGYVLARFTVDAVGKTVNILVNIVQVEEVVLPARAIVGGLVAGTLTSVLAGFLPARRASAIPPVAALRPAILGAAVLPSYAGAAVAGLLVLVGSVVLVALPPRLIAVRIQLAATATLFLGVALVMPQATIVASRALRAPLRALFRVRGFLAADNVLRYPQRSSLTAVALGGALALLVTSASVIAGFRLSTDRWMRRSLPFDLSIQPAQLSATIYSGTALPGDLVERCAKVPGVAEVYGVRATIQEWREFDVMLLGIEFEPYERVLRSKSMATSVGTAGDALRSGEAVSISRNFATLYGVHPGDVLELATPSGLKKFPVALEFEDYSWPQGVIGLSLEAYRRIWHDPTLSYVDFTIAPGAREDDVRAAIADKLGSEYGALVYSGAEIREYGGAMVDQSFALVNAQVFVSMAIGFFGIVNTLLISVLQRTREIGLLRVVGMTRRETASTVVLESLLVAVTGGLLGVLAGLFASALPAAAHVLRMTGHEVPFVIPWMTVAVVWGSAIALGFLASILPARRAAGLNVLDAIGYE